MHAHVLWLLITVVCAVKALSEATNPFLAAIGELPLTVEGPNDVELGHGRAVSQEIHGQLDMDITQPHHMKQKHHHHHASLHKSRREERTQNEAELKAEAFDTLLKQQTEELIKGKVNQHEKKLKRVQEQGKEWIEAEVSSRHNKTARVALRQHMLTPKAGIEEESTTKELLDPEVRQDVQLKKVTAKKVLRPPLDVSLGIQQLQKQISREQKAHQKALRQLRRKIDALARSQDVEVQEVRQVHDEVSAISSRVDAMIKKVERWEHESRQRRFPASTATSSHSRLHIPATQTVKRKD